MNKRLSGVTVLSAVTLGGCATIPIGPSVLVLPGSGKSFEAFQADTVICRQFADFQVGGRSATEVAQEGTAKSAVLGTALGAAVGAAAGRGEGAVIGGASGLALGGLIGSGPAYDAASELQRRYDHAYLQCMYAKGNQVPVAGHLLDGRSRSSGGDRYYGTPPPPPPGAMPPPPQGAPPQD